MSCAATTTSRRSWSSPTSTRTRPASGVYFVRGDATDAEDLERAGIAEASAALVFPADGSDEADMHSILTIMAIESIAPDVRTVAEVNNPRHEPHFRARRRRRAPGHLQGRLAPARALGAVPGPDRRS